MASCLKPTVTHMFRMGEYKSRFLQISGSEIPILNGIPISPKTGRTAQSPKGLLHNGGKIFYKNKINLHNVP